MVDHDRESNRQLPALNDGGGRGGGRGGDGGDSAHSAATSVAELKSEPWTGPIAEIKAPELTAAAAAEAVRVRPSEVRPKKPDGGKRKRDKVARPLNS